MYSLLLPEIKSKKSCKIRGVWLDQQKGKRYYDYMKQKLYDTLPISELEKQKASTGEICLFFENSVSNNANIFYDKNHIELLKTKVYYKVKKTNRSEYKTICKHFIKKYGAYTTKIGNKYYTVESWK